MKAVLENTRLSSITVGDRDEILTSPSCQAFLRDAWSTGLLVRDVLCSGQSGREVMLRPVQLSGGRFSCRSLSPEHHHTPGCPCWEGSHEGGGAVGRFDHTNIFSDRLSGGDSEWDDLSPQWRSHADFPRFAAWCFSEAMLRAYLQRNPSLASVGAKAGVTFALLGEKLQQVFSSRFFGGERSFDDEVRDAGMSVVFGLFPTDLMERWERPSLGVKPLEFVERGSYLPLPLFYDATTVRSAGRCTNIGGRISGPYFFVAIGAARKGFFKARQLTLFPIARLGDLVFGPVDSNFERRCLLSNPARSTLGFKPMLLSHLVDVYAACGIRNPRSLDVRVDLVIPEGQVVTAVEFLGLRTSAYLHCALAKQRLSQLETRLRVKYVVERAGKIVGIAVPDLLHLASSAQSPSLSKKAGTFAGDAAPCDKS